MSLVFFRFESILFLLAQEINTCLKLLINLNIEVPLFAALFEEPENAQIMIK